METKELIEQLKSCGERKCPMCPDVESCMGPSWLLLKSAEKLEASISRDALIKKLFPYGMPDDGNYPINAKAVMKAIMDTAAAMSRCKECKHCNPFGECSHPMLCADDSQAYLQVSENDFCSYWGNK